MIRQVSFPSKIKITINKKVKNRNLKERSVLP